MFDVKEFHWVEWRRLVPKYVHNTAVPYPEIVVPTVETVKLEWLLKEMFLVTKIKFVLDIVEEFRSNLKIGR